MDSNTIGSVSATASSPLSQTILTLNHNITLAEAEAMIKEYETKLPVLMSGGLASVPNVLPLTDTFNSADIQQLLNVTGTAAMRIYFGMDSSSKVRLILVSAFNDGTDPIMNQDTNLPIKENGLRDPA